jgi:cold-inducible RNA-binding protein
VADKYSKPTFLLTPKFLFFYTLIFYMNIFVAKLDFKTDTDTLRAHFEQFGEVSSASVITDRDTGRSKGFGFVEMANDEDAENAIKALDNTEFDGRTIVVKKAEPREERGSGGGGNRGGGGGYGGNRGGGGGYGKSRY